MSLYYSFEKLSLKGKFNEEKIVNRVLKEDVIDSDSQTLIARKYEPLTEDLGQIKAAGYSSVEVVNVGWDEGLFLKSLQKDTTTSTDDALKEIYETSPRRSAKRHECEADAKAYFL